MATKAKLTLSQFLFRRTGNNNNNNSTTPNNNNNNNNNNNGQVSNNINNSHSVCGKNEHFSNGTVTGGGGDAVPGMNSHHPSSSSAAATAAAVNRRMSVGSSGGAGGRPASFEGPHPSQRSSLGDAQHNLQRQYQHQTSPQQQAQQQLHGILKKPSNAGDFSPPGGGGGLGGRTHRSSLHRSKSNPNPSNNPLKEVSWSCPTLEKRREVILNYFERIILENKQEQYGKSNNTTKPNIPCDPGSGEPIYEEISDFSGPSSAYSNVSDNNGNKTGSLKPKLGPKKVRMNIPQDHHPRNGGSNHGPCPIYDKVLCRSQSMLESSTSSSSVSSSSFYDVAPSTATSISSSGSHSHYENFRPSTYYAPSSSSSSCDSDYGTVGGGGIYANSSNGSGKILTTRMAGRSHSFHDNYRDTGNYNIQASPATSAAAAPLLTVDTDQLYAKVCKRKKLKVNNNEHQQQQQHHYHHQPPNQQQHQRPSSYPTTTDTSDYCELGSDELHVQVSCGNVVTMIPVMMPCSAASSFSTSCLSLSSSSDNNTDDMTITTSISSINTRNHANHNNKNGFFHYEAEKIIPDKHIAYINGQQQQREGPDFSNGTGVADSCPPSSAAARNRNNLSVIHLLATYNPAKEVEEFIPSSSPPSFSTAIIDSTDCAPKSISVPVRVNFSKSSKNCTNNMNSYCKDNQDPASRQPLMVANCTFGYDNDAFQDDDDADADEEDNNNNNHHHLNLLRSNPTKDIPSSPGTTTSSSSTSGADDGDDGCCSSGTSDTDTDEEEHHTQKYSFSNNGNKDRGVLKNQHHHRVKSITFQDDSTASTTAKDLLLLTTSESEDDEEICEHKSLIDMNHSGVILDESSSGRGDKYSMNMMDDEDRGFDSFLDESENNGDNKGDGSPSSFRTENLRNQRTFSQMAQDVPHEQLKKKASSVLDLINSEISDLHMRELELKKLHSPVPPKNGEKDQDGSAEEFEDSGEDDFSDSAIEYDGFTTNGSHSSGQVSPSENMNEIISQQDEIPKPEPRKPRDGGLPVGVQQRPAIGDEEDGGDEEAIRRDPVDYSGGVRGEVKVRPMEDEEDRSIKFPTSDETPIEREIRLTKEREDEFRRNNTNQLAVCPPAPTPSPKGGMGSLPVSSPAPTPSPKGGMGSLPVSKARTTISSRPENPQSKSEFSLASLPITVGATKDIQMEMATARFKKEIEENMKRENEMIRDIHQKKISEPEISKTEAVSPPPVVPEAKKSKEATTTTTPRPKTPQQSPTPSLPQAVGNSESQTQLRKPTLAKLHAARFFAPPAFNANKQNKITPVVSPIISKGNLGFPNTNNPNAIGGSLPVGINRPSFNSFEKYILQTSINYMAKQNGSTPGTPASPSFSMNEDSMKNLVADPGVVNKNFQFHNITEDPLRIVQKPSMEEADDGDKEDDDEKPKKRYIPAQDKINQEIQDLAMREKELNQFRGKWKSTLDLPEALKDAEEEKEVLRRTTSITTQSNMSLNTVGNTIIVSKDNVATANTRGGAADGNSDDANNSDGESDKLNLTNVTAEDVRQVTRVKAPARRRHSLLINQWEERIRQQQQLNSKK